MLRQLLADACLLAEEVVVLDTGSEDATVSVARAAGARVITTSWPGSFATARNLAIAHCTTPWVLMLDADERIIPTDRPLLEEAIASDYADVFRLIQRTYSDDAELLDWQPCGSGAPSRGAAGFQDVRVGRLFRRQEELRFEGRIHELIEPAAERAGCAVADLPVVIHHYKEAQSAEKKAEKTELYLRLSRDKHSEERSSQSALELAMAASSAGDHETAVSTLEPFIDSGRYIIYEHLALAWLALEEYAKVVRFGFESQHAQGRRLAGLVGQALLHLGREGEAKGYLRRARLEPTATYRALVDLGVVHLREDEWTDAEACLLEARELHPRGDLPWFNLGLLRRKQDRLPEAEASLREAARLNPRRWQTHAELAGLAFERHAYQEALTHAQRAMACTECGAEGYLRGCAAELALGHFEDALGHARQAASLDPKWSGLEAQVWAQVQQQRQAAS